MKMAPMFGFRVNVQQKKKEKQVSSSSEVVERQKTASSDHFQAFISHEIC